MRRGWSQALFGGAQCLDKKQWAQMNTGGCQETLQVSQPWYRLPEGLGAPLGELQQPPGCGAGVAPEGP